MTDGLAWIGEHWYSGAIVKDGMISDICLTAVRGVDPVDFVVRLGADRRMAERATLFADFDRLSVGASDSVAMFGRSGEWAYVLETEWSTYQHLILDRADHKNTLVRQGEEFVCLDRFVQETPWVCYGDVAGEMRAIEPGDSLLVAEFPLEDRFGAFAALDASLREAGAVWDTFPGVEDPDDPWAEEEELARRLFGAVGEHLGLSLPRRQIEKGLLPTVVLSSPF